MHFQHGGIFLNLIRSEFLVYRIALWKLIDEIHCQQNASFGVLASDFYVEQIVETGESTHKHCRRECSSDLRELYLRGEGKFPKSVP